MIAAVIVIGLVGFVLDRAMNLIEQNANYLLSLPSKLMRRFESFRAARIALAPPSSAMIELLEPKETSDAAA